MLFAPGIEIADLKFKYFRSRRCGSPAYLSRNADRYFVFFHAAIVAYLLAGHKGKSAAPPSHSTAH